MLLARTFIRIGVRLSFLAVYTLLVSCTTKQSSTTDAVYIGEIDRWHAERVEKLKSPSGWLNVAGLYWLNNGINSFGASGDNDLVFPEKLGAAKAGFYLLEDGKVKLTLLPNAAITSKGQVIQEILAFNPDSTRQPVMEFGSLRWFVIRRDTKYGVRLRDLESPALQDFHGIERFPVDRSWLVTASWEATPGRTIPITNVLGQTTPQDAPGVLVFTLNNREFRLDALDEGVEDELFIIFGDATNTKETYGAGRYLYVRKPDEHGEVIVDFNKAENPPCAFTDFATCPLPPRQNVMDVAVLAGEKEYKHP